MWSDGCLAARKLFGIAAGLTAAVGLGVCSPEIRFPVLQICFIYALLLENAFDLYHGVYTLRVKRAQFACLYADGFGVVAAHKKHLCSPMLAGMSTYSLKFNLFVCQRLCL